MFHILTLFLQKYLYGFFRKKKRIQPLNNVNIDISQHTILIVDDLIVFTNIMKKFAKDIGIEYFCVKNCKEAIECFHYFKFDIVLTDIEMPLMDGLELIKNIRKNSNVPIIATSTNKNYSYSALYNGANIFLEKPFRAELFNKSIYELIPNCNFYKI